MNAYRVLVGKPKGERLLEDKNLSGWTVLKLQETVFWDLAPCIFD
jgi:hypothetical protein